MKKTGTEILKRWGRTTWAARSKWTIKSSTNEFIPDDHQLSAAPDMFIHHLGGSRGSSKATACGTSTSPAALSLFPQPWWLQQIEEEEHLFGIITEKYEGGMETKPDKPMFAAKGFVVIDLCLCLLSISMAQRESWTTKRSCTHYKSRPKSHQEPAKGGGGRPYRDAEGATLKKYGRTLVQKVEGSARDSSVCSIVHNRYQIQHSPCVGSA